MFFARNSIKAFPLVALMFFVGCNCKIKRLQCKGSENFSNAVSLPLSELSSIEVTPDDSHFPVGLSPQFQALGTFADLSVVDITDSVNWDTSNHAVAGVDSTGLANALSAGVIQVTASLAGVTGTTELTVTSSTLVSIAISPPDPVLPVSATEQFTATGTYSDSLSYDISDLVTWDSSSQTDVSIDSAGLATMLTCSDEQITATYQSIIGTTNVDCISSNATLSALTLSAGTLAPVFSSGTTDYTATVGNSASSIRVRPTATAADSTIEVRVNGGTYSTVSSGVLSSALPLDVGNNPIDIKVTAEDGITTAIYSVIVRRVSTVATLSALEADPIGSGIFPAFSPSTLNYSLDTDLGTPSVDVSATTTDTNSTLRMSINAGAFVTVTSGVPVNVPVSVGITTVRFQVRAEDGVTSQTYRLSITKLGI